MVKYGPLTFDRVYIFREVVDRVASLSRIPYRFKGYLEDVGGEGDVFELVGELDTELFDFSVGWDDPDIGWDSVLSQWDSSLSMKKLDFLKLLATDVFGYTLDISDIRTVDYSYPSMIMTEPRVTLNVREPNRVKFSCKFIKSGLS